MSSVTGLRSGIVAAVVALALAPAGSRAENFTAETTKLLKESKLGPEIMAGLDKELAMPAAIVEGARREGLVKARMTLNVKEFAKVAPVFEARYPGVKIEYIHGIGRERAVAPLLAFKRGTILSDVLFAIDSQERDYREAKALLDLRDLPGWANVPAGGKASDGLLAAAHNPHYCMSYNKNTVKKAELPKTWDELVDNPRWHGGKVGMAVNVHVWVAPLWAIKGDAWTDAFLAKLFTVLKPQLRKEQLSMTPRLNAIGEFDLSVPAGDFAVRPYEDQGMPVSYHCPDIVPKGNTSIAIVAGSPRTNAAKLFVNWILSKEGQIALSYAGQIIPSHKDLQIAQLLPYASEVLGKTMAPVDDRVRPKTPEIVAKFHKLWTSQGGGGGPN